MSAENNDEEIIANLDMLTEFDVELVSKDIAVIENLEDVEKSSPEEEKK